MAVASSVLQEDHSRTNQIWDSLGAAHRQADVLIHEIGSTVNRNSPMHARPPVQHGGQLALFCVQALNGQGLIPGWA
jgi:hypothetical protein